LKKIVYSKSIANAHATHDRNNTSSAPNKSQIWLIEEPVLPAEAASLLGAIVVVTAAAAVVDVAVVAVAATRTTRRSGSPSPSSAVL
jgi:hypothetical protein